MRDVLPELDRWKEQREEIALATLVRVHGSAPRLPGARLCVTRSGRMAGSVSGGCVENDVYERAMQVLDSGQPVVASYGIADETGFEVGLSCGGTIDVLIEPFVEEEVWKSIRRAVEHQRPGALAIGLAPPALIGRKLALLDGARTLGSVDASLDEQIIAAARAAWRQGATEVLSFPWRGEEASVFIEVIPPPLRLFIVGATHIAVALCRMAKALGFWVSIIDARGTYATRERFPEADTILLAEPGEVLGRAGLDAYSHVVILTHDPKFDIPALARALRSETGYIGVMGSRGTHGRRAVALEQEGFTEADLSRIRAPIGLDIGARSPEEMALAILAEMVAVRHERDGCALREKKGAIHGGA
jgi:xanthine dehydrogenase accessory factor